MERPLNKKYFGNRNIGSISTTADNGIGGQGIASVTLTAGSLGAYTTRPTTTFDAPTTPGGVTAVGTVTSEVNAVTGQASGTGYVTGDTVTIGNGTVFTITASGGAITGVSAINNRGLYPYAGGALPTGAQNVTKITGNGSGGTITVNYRANSVLISETGSGYTAVPNVTFTQSVAGTAVLTVPTGAVGSATYDERAIIAYAYTGSSSKIADIVKQVSTDRYKVNTSDTSGTPIIAKLKTSGAASSVGEMTITATDSSGKTYYIKKLTARRAVLVPYGTTGHEFPLVNGLPQSVRWTFSAPTLNTTVKIANG